MKVKSMIDIGGTIIDTFILQSDQEYHATSDIIVDGGYLIHEPGATIEWTENTGLYVRNNGTYISRGLPSDLCAHMADTESSPSDYWKGILIEESASSNCEIRYSLVQDANSGIENRNKRLRKFIEHNIVEFCHVGIKSYGPNQTKITNNLCYWNDIAIQAFHRAYDGTFDPSLDMVNIEQNTCYDNYYGIWIEMVDGTNIVEPVVINNISAGSNGYNYVMVNGDFWIDLFLNNGSWLNPEYPSSEHIYYFAPADFGIIIESGTNPFSGYEIDNVYLRQDSAFVDAGYQDIIDTTIMGTTTSMNDKPDSGMTDLGFHYSNWDHSDVGSSTLQSDLDNSLTVDIDDLSIIAEYWLLDYAEAYEIKLRDLDDSGYVDLGDLQIIAENWLDPDDFLTFAWFAQKWMEEVDMKMYNTEPDIFEDGIINFRDYAILASEWQETGEPSTDPNIQINTSLDTSSGYVEVSISGYHTDTINAFLFVNGCFEDDMFGFRQGEKARVNLYELGDGCCELKVISVNGSGKLTCSNIQTLNFDSPMKYLCCPEAYYLNEPYNFCAYSAAPNQITVKAFNLNDSQVWSQTYPGENANGFVPASVTSSNALAYLSFEVSTGALLSEETVVRSSPLSLPPVVKVPTTKGFDPEDVPAGVDSLIILPDNWTDWFTNRRVTGMVRQAFNYEYELKGGEAISTNIAWFIQNRNIKYIYYNGHGNYKIGEDANAVLRTCIKLSDGITFSARRSDYANPDQAPSWCVALPAGYENARNLSFAQMGDFTHLLFAHFDVCYTARLKLDGGELKEGEEDGSKWMFDGPDSDMSWALRSPLYQGWYDICPQGGDSEFSEFSYIEWTELRDNEALFYAIMEAINNTSIDPVSGRAPYEDVRVKGREDIYSVRVE